jgi:hypothetical protein
MSNSHISYLHLETGAKVELPSLTHVAALLVDHGRISVTTQFPERRRRVAPHGLPVPTQLPLTVQSASSRANSEA